VLADLINFTNRQ
jgi:hypothetical protein